jgi:tRNA pseudouridine55 synthase
VVVSTLSLDGLLVIDKPEGPTSHDVVARMRRVLGERRIGHTGTLDPLATGVLALLLGRATRLAQFLSGDEKQYRAQIRLGQATTTYDREGEPTGDAVTVETLEAPRIEAALDAFRGRILQTPPIYSAKKIGGQSAHRLARRGEAAALAPVEVTVHALTLVAVDGADVIVDVRCSAGFYVRSLAHDLGVRLGCGAHLRALRRTAAGPLDLEGALALADAEARPEVALAHLRPLSALLPDWPSVRLTTRGEARVRTGAAIGPADCEEWTEPDLGPDPGTGVEPGGGTVTVRLLDAGGDLVALGAWVGGRESPLLHPRVVLV